MKESNTTEFTIDPVKLGQAISMEADIDFLFEGVPGYMETCNEESPIAYKKVTGAVLPWTWYIYEASRDIGLFSAFVVGNFPECGTVSLKELCVAGIKIDKSFEPTPLNDIMDKHMK